MKYSTFSQYITKQAKSAPEAEKLLSAAKRNGLDAVEIFDYEFDSISASVYRKIIEDSGLFTAAVIAAERDRGKWAEKSKKLVEYAALMGTERVMAVPLISSDRTEVFEALCRTQEEAQRCDIMLSIENFSTADVPFSSFDDIEYMLTHIKDLKFNFDSGNFFCMGLNVLTAFEKFKDNTVSVHVKDWVYADKGVLPLGNRFLEGVTAEEGMVPHKELFARMKENGFDGILTAEINSIYPIENRWQNCVDSIRRMTL